jgi:hypothetical protein
VGVSVLLLFALVSVCVFEPNTLLNRTLSRQLACAWNFCVIRIFSGILSCSARSWPQHHSKMVRYAYGTWFAASAWHHRKHERGQPMKFRGNELATSHWMVPYVKTIKVLNSGSVLIVFNSSYTSDTFISTRSTYFILWVFFPDQSKLSGFRQKMTGHHQISWRQRNFCISSKIQTCEQHMYMFSGSKTRQLYDALSFTFYKSLFFPVEK